MDYWRRNMNKCCVKCVNDKTVKHISFDNNGVCSFCKSYDNYLNKTKSMDLKALFLDKLGEGSYDYDCAVGFSGGKDSTYVLYKLVKEYKLNVIAYTLDNGFLSSEAKDKIDRIVKELGVKHEYVICDMDLLKKTYKHIVSKFLSPCIACSFLGYAVMINYASKVNARVGVHGRSPYQMFRNYNEDFDDVFKPFIDAGLKKDVNLDELYNNVIKMIDKLVDKKLAYRIKNELLGDAYKYGFRDFISYFLYHDYNKDEIINFLEANTSWKLESEEEHFDCLIHNGALYLKDLTARRSHLMPEYSVMIRDKIITKEMAYKLMEKRIDKDVAKKEIKMLCKYAKINYYLLMIKAKIYSLRWW